MDLMLYHSLSGANSVSALIYMEEKRIRYGSRSVDSLALDQLRDKRTADCPSGLPLLANQSIYITGPTRISRYVEDLVPDTRLQPDSVAGRASMHQWLDRIEGELVPILNQAPQMLLAERLEKERWPGRPVYEGVTLSALLVPLFEDIEAALTQFRWLAGSRYSLADIHAFPLIARFVRLLPDYADRKSLPRTLAWLEAISDRSAVHRVVSFLEDRSAAPGPVSVH